MEKKKYLKELKKCLKGFSGDEKNDIVNHYSELIDDAIENGYPEGKIEFVLGDPSSVAEKIKNDVTGENKRKISIKKQRLINWFFYFSIITIPLTLGLGAGALAIVISILAVILTFFITGYALAFSFVAILLYSIILGIQTQSILIFTISISASLLVLAIGLLMVYISKIIIKYCFRVKRIKVKYEIKFSTLSGILGILILVISIFMGSLNENNWNKLATSIKTNKNLYEQYEKHEVTYDNISIIDYKSSSKNLKITESDEVTSLKVIYYSSKSDNVNFIVDNNTLIMEQKYDYNFKLVDASWIVYLIENDFSHEMIEIIVPSNFNKIDCFIKSSSGNIEATNLNVGNFQVKYSSGNVEIENCDINKSVIDSKSGNLLVGNSTILSLDIVSHSGNTSLHENTIDEISIKMVSGNINIKYCDINFLTTDTTSGNTNINSCKFNKVTSSTNSGNMDMSFNEKNKVILNVNKLNSGNVRENNKTLINERVSSPITFIINPEITNESIEINISIVSGNFRYYD